MSTTFNLKQKPMRKYAVYALVFVFVFQLSAGFTVLADDAPGDTVIATGDASVSLGAGNDINQNIYASTGPTGNTTADPAIADPLPADNGNTAIDPTASPDANQDSQIIPDQQTADANTDPAALIADTIGQSGTGTGDLNVLNNQNNGAVGNNLAGTSTTGTNGITGSDGNTYILTGDAGLGSAVANNVNGNIASTTCPDCPGDGATTTTLVDNTNLGSTTNAVKLTGITGDNQIATSGGDAVISTGDANIISVIVNFINTNIFGKGVEYFVNVWNNVMQNLDLSGYQGQAGQAGDVGACEVNNCLVSINNLNTGEIANDVVIAANTGGNAIASTSGAAIIETGDINITNDVLNIANLNITGNGWFFAVVNIFGELNGDIILPPYNQATGTKATTSLVEKLATKGTETAEVIITNTNNAAVVNSSDVQANTGSNDIGTSSDAVITTGNATVRSQTFNLINYNVYGDTWKFARVNIFGDWHGFINGLPPGYNYVQDDGGITVYSDILDDPALNAQFAKLLVNNQNNATTTNSITIDASTGDNSILHAGGGATIDTGNINIMNSLLNFINSNFTGDNWQFSMINVFGKWQGNLAFGQPDLWITESIKSPTPAVEGNGITYTFLYGNKGDSAATNVQLEDIFDDSYMKAGSLAGGIVNGNKIRWTLDNIPPNSQGSFSYTLKVKDDIPDASAQVANQVKISGTEGDRNYDDNTAGGSFTAEHSRAPLRNEAFDIANLSGGGEGMTALSVIKTNDAADIVNPGDIVNFHIVADNNGAIAAEEVYVMDKMINLDTNEVINESFWNLGTVQSNEEVMIDYSLEITNVIKTGTYINQVVVEGWDPAQGIYATAYGSSKIEVVNDDWHEPGPANIAVTHTPAESQSQPGSTVDYTITVTNNGGVQAKDSYVSVSLPKGLTFYGENGINYKQWYIELLNPGGFQDIEFTVALDDNIENGLYTSQAVARVGNQVTGTNNATLAVKNSLQKSGVSANNKEQSNAVVAQSAPNTSIRRTILSGTTPDNNETGGAAQQTGDVVSVPSVKPAVAAAFDANNEMPAPENPWYNMAKLGLALVLLLILFILVSITQKYMNARPRQIRT